MAQLHIKTTEIQLKFRAFHKRWQHHILKFSFEFNYHAIIRSIFSWEIDMGEMLFRRIWFLYYLSVFSTIIFLCSFLEICLPEKNFFTLRSYKDYQIEKMQFSSFIYNLLTWFFEFHFRWRGLKMYQSEKSLFWSDVDQIWLSFFLEFPIEWSWHHWQVNQVELGRIMIKIILNLKNLVWIYLQFVYYSEVHKWLY